ncbi:hypothetical protein CFter6_2934 [Collimonas fungivorans]|uniref:Uncharacterized protein n=1 Tax=Collimonas fungivorans TaxID=158899 RepID=A0A127PCQ8_9BURK|nr:hypothetical protein CFter6_2934 [Collimonas fungivorans]
MYQIQNRPRTYEVRILNLFKNFHNTISNYSSRTFDRD